MQRLLQCIFLAFLAVLRCPQAYADDINFFDTVNNGLRIGAAGFISSPLVLNGNYTLTTPNYVEDYTTLPSGSIVTFSGTKGNFFDPSNFSSVYDFVEPNSPSVVLERFVVQGYGSGPAYSLGSETINGTFYSYGSQPLSIGNGDSVVDFDATGHGLVILGATADSIGIGVYAPAQDLAAAVPEPDFFTIVLLCVGVSIAARSQDRRSRAGQVHRNRERRPATIA